jgi:transcriptional regulator with XRE-family HTH domain
MLLLANPARRCNLMGLKDLRLAQGLSINHVARRARICSGNLSRYERGLRKPKPDTLRKIARALRVPVAEIREIFKAAG